MIQTDRKELTLQEKTGQMLCFSFHGTTYNEQLKTLIEEMKIGNIVHFARNIIHPAQVTALNQAMQDHARIPLFISLDQEGGMVRRITGEMTYLPGAMSLAASKEREVRSLYRQVGRELKAMGFSVNYAPVADINNNINNPVINSRSYGDDPQEVAHFVKEAFLGFQDAAILPTVKHFPGHGDTAVDSHLGLPVVSKSLADLKKVELVPFKEAIDVGLDGIMVAHILFDQLDDTYPSTLSYPIITKLLKEELGFKGLITTDSLTMAAVWRRFSVEEIIKKGVLAGNDILVFCGEATLAMQQEIASTFIRLVETGEIPLSRVEESVAKILHLKERYTKKEKQGFTPVSTLPLVEQSITKVKDGGLLPLSPSKKNLLVFPLIKLGSLVDDFTKETTSFRTFLQMDEVIVAGEEEMEKVVQIAPNYDTIVIGTYQMRENDLTHQLIKRLDGSKLIVAALRSPYDLVLVKHANSLLCTYDCTKESLASLAKRLMDNQFEGKAPIYLEGIK